MELTYDCSRHRTQATQNKAPPQIEVASRNAYTRLTSTFGNLPSRRNQIGTHEVSPTAEKWKAEVGLISARSKLSRMDPAQLSAYPPGQEAETESLPRPQKLSPIAQVASRR